MSKILLANFAAIAVSVIGVLDYTMQSRRADVAFGSLGIGDYLATMGTRYSGMKSEQFALAEAGSLRRQEMRTLLPEAPAGWTMREWNEGDRARLFPSREIYPEGEEVPEGFEAFAHALQNDPQLRAMTEANDRALVASEKATIRFYQRGDAVIALRLDFNRIASGISLNGAIDPNNMTATGMSIIEGNMTAMSGRDGFAVIGGVPFSREYGMFGFAGDVDDPTVVRAFRGRMGPEIKIQVRALATDADVADLLGQIDFDTLNKVLTTPLEGVGRDAPAISPEDSQAIAAAAVNAEADAVIARGRQSEADLRATGAEMQGIDPDKAAVEGQNPGGVFGLLLRRSAETRASAAAEEAAAAEAPPPEGSLAALMAGGASASPEPATAAAEPAPAAAEPTAEVQTGMAAATPAPQVRVRRAGSIGGENCEMTGVGKRCSLLGD